MKLLQGQLAVVTGAGRGIGRAIALKLASEGAQLVLAARTESELMTTAQECEKSGIKASAYAMDLGEEQGVRSFAAKVLQEKGFVDILVNNAGIYGPIGPSEQVSYADWSKAHFVNLLCPFLLTQLLAPSMKARKKGKIIFLGGGGATAPMPYFAAYASTKAAVVRLAETLAMEWQGDNIQVNAVAPGLVDTKIQDQVLAAGGSAGPLWEKISKARKDGSGAVSPDVAAELIAFLASEDSGTMTGKLISAPYDSWKSWKGQSETLNASPMYTLRRLDPFTIKPLLDKI